MGPIFIKFPKSNKRKFWNIANDTFEFDFQYMIVGLGSIRRKRDAL